jgi:hypothetical protein
VPGFEKGCKRLVVGTGTDAATYPEAEGCEVAGQLTSKAIQALNAAKNGTNGLFHVTY